MNARRTGWVLALVLLVGAAAVAAWVGPIGERSAWPDGRDEASSPSSEEARALIVRRCSICHLTPDENVLPASGWERFLGRKSQVIAQAVQDRGIDSTLVLSGDELRRITDYLTAAAPTEEELVGPPVRDVEPSGWFELIAKQPLEDTPAPQGYIGVMVDSAARQVLVTDLMRAGIEVVDYAGATVGFATVGPVPARMTPTADGLLVALMEGPEGGKVVRVRRDGPPENWSSTPLLGDLYRPIRAYPTTIQGRAGMLTEEFGTGLRFWPEDASGGFESAVPVVDRAGVVASAIADLTGDGREDLVVLVSEEYEQILLFSDIRTSMDAPTVVYQAHPAFGFNGMVLSDIDGDGRLDLLVLNGDNADIDTGPLKPYHGLRIFRNVGGGQFSEPLFLPFHGVVDAVVRDFNGSGRVDIVAVASFPDHRITPYHSAMVFEQVAPMRFVPRLIEPALGSRWIAVAAPDLDGDGVPDLVLAGGQSMSNEAERRWSRLAGPDPAKLMFLRNVRAP